MNISQYQPWCHQQSKSLGYDSHDPSWSISFWACEIHPKRSRRQCSLVGTKILSMKVGVMIIVSLRIFFGRDWGHSHIPKLMFPSSLKIIKFGPGWRQHQVLGPMAATKFGPLPRPGIFLPWSFFQLASKRPGYSANRCVCCFVVIFVGHRHCLLVTCCCSLWCS